MILLYFNSIKVRLKLLRFEGMTEEEFNFNSIKVRLKRNRFGFGGVHDDISIP